MPCCLCWSWANGSCLNSPSRPASAMTHTSATSCWSGSSVFGCWRNSFTSSPKLTLVTWPCRALTFEALCTIWAAMVEGGGTPFELPLVTGGGAIRWVELPPLRAMMHVTDVACRVGWERVQPWKMAGHLVVGGDAGFGFKRMPVQSSTDSRWYCWWSGVWLDAGGGLCNLLCGSPRLSTSVVSCYWYDSPAVVAKCAM